MPPKGHGKEKEVLEGQEEEPLQAVILADSFNNRFKPLTTRTPRCLLPVCNAPLLDWTFESLALAGVREIFVVCRSHAEQVKAAIQKSKWSDPHSGVKITPVVTAKEAFSPGDAMRDIYTHGIVTSDFVLVHGDLVSNVRIDEVVREHKERRRTDKDAIMTIVVKESGARHRTRPQGENSVFVLDEGTQECLHYEPVKGYPVKDYIRIPREILSEHPDLDIRNDLIDCGIDICSAEVPSLFQDNFDYQEIRNDFVHGVLTSDLLMKKIHCHVLSDGYAARVKDTKSYASVTKDILARWSFPLVPDDNHPGSASTSYEHLRGNKYLSLSSPPQMARTSFVGSLTMLGPDVAITSDAHVSGSVLGARCVIGQGAVVTDSILWDGVKVEAGAIVQGSVLGRGVTVLKGSKIEKGCLIADEVVLGPNAKLKRFTRVSRRREANEEAGEDDEDEDDLDEIESSQTEEMKQSLGSQSNGLVWPEDELAADTTSEEDDDEADERTNMRLLRLGDSASDLELSDDGSLTESSDEESDDEDSMGALGLSLTSPGTSFSSQGLVGEGKSAVLDLADAQALKEFEAEVDASLERSFSEGHTVDNAAVELKTLRMASNVPLRRVREAVIEHIVKAVPLVADNSAKQRKAIADVIGRWGELINSIGGVDAVETIEALQECCSRTLTQYLSLFGQLLAALYQEDIIEETDIRAWHASPKSRGPDENMKRCWLVGGKMIEQLDAQESSEEEESDDEDDED